MKVYSTKIITEIKELRSAGFSINEIVTKLNIPKTSIWHHIKNLKISSKYEKILRSKRGGSAKRSQHDWVDADVLAAEILTGKQRQLAIAISMLYWAEGSKKACEFINSDGKMIGLYLDFVRSVLLLSENRIKPTMRIFTGMDEQYCLDYWVNITKISAESFTLRYNDGGLNGNTRYGMCRITIRKGSFILKLMHCLINKVVLEFEAIYNKAPVAQRIEQRTPNAQI